MTKAQRTASKRNRAGATSLDMAFRPLATSNASVTACDTRLGSLSAIFVVVDIIWIGEIDALELVTRHADTLRKVGG